jgi:hypothetical protein
MHQMRIARFGPTAVSTLLLAAALGAPAMAHVTVDTEDGRYAVEVGFQNEPAYLGQPNALFVKVSRYGTGGAEPVDGVAGTLTAEVEKDGQTKELPLVPQGEGEYLGVFHPTALGDYTFRLGGEIEGSPVEIEETSSPTTFDPVEPLAAVQFPEELPAPADLAMQAAAAESAAATARTFGIAGVAIGALGVVLAAVALARKR